MLRKKEDLERGKIYQLQNFLSKERIDVSIVEKRINSERGNRTSALWKAMIGRLINAGFIIKYSLYHIC